MKKHIKKLPLLFLLFALINICSGCDDFIEKDLEEKEVKVRMPANNSEISTTTVSFWWEKLEGALEYNVQVVSPSFSQPQRLLADSIVSDNKLMLSLMPGNFEWRIKALNGSSETDFVTIAFSIDSTLNLPDETIILRSPGNNTITNNINQTFRWDILYGATEYHFRLENTTGEFVKDETVTNTEISFELPDGIYNWRVRGQNDVSYTPYKSSSLQIDTEIPGAPTLSSPIENAQFFSTDSVPFSWSRVVDNGSPLFDSLYVFTDKNLTIKKLSKRIEKSSYKDIFETGTYYWYVKTCDLAGNVSERPESAFSFVIN